MDRAILSLLLACGLRRGEVAALKLDDIQRREDHWAVVDLTGKAGHVRTVPLPDWVTRAIGEWVTAAGIQRWRARIPEHREKSLVVCLG
jgi:integrase